MAENNSKIKKKIFWIVLGIIAVCLLAAIFVSSLRIPVVSEPNTTEPAQQTVSLVEMMQGVVSLKDDLKAILRDMKNNDWKGAGEKTDEISVNIKAIQSLVHSTRNLLGDNFFLRDQLDNVQNILDLADMGIRKLVRPLITQLDVYPLDQLSADGGINTRLVGSYLDFAQTVMPDVEAILAMAEGTDLSMIDAEGKLAGYIERIKPLLALYQEYRDVIPLLRDILGVEKDRLYLIAAQNSTEIRASGGFPGAMGTVRITDGILKMEDFKTVYDVLATYTPKEANITSKENKLFHNGLKAPRDADYCPDFERVAYIWALGYEDKQKEPIDGVISLTPCIVQRLLAVMGGQIELFDGTVLNGENATKVLQYDLYYKYFGNKKIKNNAEIADDLFADAAKKLMEMLTDNLELSYLPGFLSVAKQSFTDRTLMLWMKDEQQQSMIRQMGWHGGLNEDPENPQAGVYYSCTLPSKMGWFLAMDTQIGERTKNEDGSYTYPVTVTFSNTITMDEVYGASVYITGGKGGDIIGSAYFFAPAGGRVSDFSASNGKAVNTEQYHDLQLGYLLSFRIRPNKQVTVTYLVTTAPGVETPLTFSKTPTVQDYHVYEEKPAG